MIMHSRSKVIMDLLRMILCWQGYDGLGKAAMKTYDLCKDYMLTSTMLVVFALLWPTCLLSSLNFWCLHPRKKQRFNLKHSKNTKTTITTFYIESFRKAYKRDMLSQIFPTCYFIARQMPFEQDTHLPPGYFAPSNIVKAAF